MAHVVTDMKSDGRVRVTEEVLLVMRREVERVLGEVTREENREAEMMR